jgi:hypothetical protein
MVENTFCISVSQFSLIFSRMSPPSSSNGIFYHERQGGGEEDFVRCGSLRTSGQRALILRAWLRSVRAYGRTGLNFIHRRGPSYSLWPKVTGNLVLRVSVSDFSHSCGQFISL